MEPPWLVTGEQYNEKVFFCPSTPSIILHGALAGCWVHSGPENVQPNEFYVLPCVRVSLEK
jgi:hypothetical protein